MIDTIKIHLPPNLVPDNFHNFYLRTATNKKKITNEGLEHFWSGNYKNINITYSKKGVYLQLSLAKFYFGSNQVTLQTEDIPKAVIKLSRALGLPLLMEGKVTRVDIAENIITEYPTGEYNKILGEARYFKRLEKGNGLTYQNCNRTITFYDKIKELKKIEVPKEILQNKNVLRCEYRLMNHQTIASFLKITEVTVKDIIDNYQKLVNGWFDVFFTINKKYDSLCFNSEVFKTKGGFDKQIRILGVEKLGGLPIVLDIIKTARGRRYFKYLNESSNLVNKYTSLMKTPLQTEKSGLASELEHKVKLIRFIASASILADGIV